MFIEIANVSNTFVAGVNYTVLYQSQTGVNVSVGEIVFLRYL